MRADQNAEYISKIRMGLCDDALARKVLLEQCQISFSFFQFHGIEVSDESKS